MRIRHLVPALLLGAASTGCISYSSIQKTDKEVYLSGATNYFVIQVPFLKRCDVDGQILRCEELKEFEPSARRGAGGAEAAPSASSAPAAPAAAAPTDKKAPSK
jgi:hypothetical protein